MAQRAIVLVLDGFGVGTMEDIKTTRPQDKGANTLANILKSLPQTHIPNFYTIGAIKFYVEDVFQPHKFHNFHISFGKANLAHLGADSYIGHQEIAGTKPQIPIRQFIREIKDVLMRSLEKEGFQPIWNGNMLLVNKLIAIADNIETDYGLNVNVVGSLDTFSFRDIEKVGLITRSIAKTGRVITMGGVGITQQKLLDAYEEKTRDGYTAWGINIPKLNIYNESYRVIHMGYGVNPNTQITQILLNANIPVTLIGKTADVIRAQGATYKPQVDTETVLKLLLEELKDKKNKFIYANVQQTDLSGHEMKVNKYAHYLEIIDQYIPKILKNLSEDDIFIITGDHGNDPTIGHTNHTREKTPIIFFSNKHPSHVIGERKTLADIGSSIATYFRVEQPEFGESFL